MFPVAYRLRFALHGSICAGAMQNAMTCLLRPSALHMRAASLKSSKTRTGSPPQRELKITNRAPKCAVLSADYV